MADPAPSSSIRPTQLLVLQICLCRDGGHNLGWMRGQVQSSGGLPQWESKATHQVRQVQAAAMADGQQGDRLGSQQPPRPAFKVVPDSQPWDQ